MYKRNLILRTDAYKLSHYLYYPEGLTEMESHLISRGGRYPKTVFFGAQGLIKDHLMTPITHGDVSYAEDFAHEMGMPFNRPGFKRMVDVHGGYFPVQIDALEEGSIVDNKNALMVVRNLDPELAFATSYIESMALPLWYPITVATRSMQMKKNVKPYFDDTSDTGDMGFAILDFGARGSTSGESAEIGGAAHLVNFMGSDTMAAVDYVKQLYGGKVLGYSVRATEHSVMCCYGQALERESIRTIIERTAPGTIVSIVCDTWNVFRCVEYIIELKDLIRAKNIAAVARPDSGDIPTVFTSILQRLAEGFGTTFNSKGYHVINGAKGLWADGMNESTVHLPFEVAKSLKISADSVMSGAGGALLQAGIDRDTNKFAFKGNNAVIHGTEFPIAKDPITDPGKKSMSGRLTVAFEDNKYTTYSSGDTPALYDAYKNQNQLKPLYRTGELLRETTMVQIRDRVNQQYDRF